MLYLYVLSPIDFWDGWTKEAQFLADHSTSNDDSWDFGTTRREYLDARRRAFIAARTSYWEGDIIAGPYVSGLPGADTSCPEILIGWKQGNNGSTFVCSPFPLPWLLSDNGHRSHYVAEADTQVIEV